MPYVNNRDVKEFVFTNKRILDLLEDIRKFFKEDVVLENAIEKYSEELHIKYSHEDRHYVACVYIQKNVEGE